MVVRFLLVKHKVLKNFCISAWNEEYLRWGKQQRQEKVCIWHQDLLETKLQSCRHQWTTLAIDRTIVLISFQFVTRRWKKFRNLYPYRCFSDCLKFNVAKLKLNCSTRCATKFDKQQLFHRSLQQEQLIIGPLMKRRGFLSTSQILKIAQRNSPQ